MFDGRACAGAGQREVSAQLRHGKWMVEKRACGACCPRRRREFELRRCGMGERRRCDGRLFPGCVVRLARLGVMALGCRRFRSGAEVLLVVG